MDIRSDEEVRGFVPQTGTREKPAEDAAGRSARSRPEHSAAQALSPPITTMIRLDHTHVLALFRRFKPSTSAARKQALVRNACLALEVHAQLEEEIFYPALREVAGENSVLAKSVPEHDEMRSLIDQIRRSSVSDDRYDEMVHALMRAVLHHVSDEESTLLPLAEARMADRLGDLGGQMTSRRMQLLRPHLGEVAWTSALSFPVAAVVLAAGLLTIAWLLTRRVTGRRRFESSSATF